MDSTGKDRPRLWQQHTLANGSGNVAVEPSSGEKLCCDSILLPRDRGSWVQMIAAVRSASRLAADVLQLRGTTRVGITGLARAGKTALLTSLAANLLALSAGRLTLPALSDRLRGRRLSVAIAPAEASGIPRFEVEPHTAALAADPPRWPERTTAVSLLALDVDVPREGLLAAIAPQRRRLEFLDYPGEWLLDLPLLSQDFTRLVRGNLAPARDIDDGGIGTRVSGVRTWPAGWGGGRRGAQLDRTSALHRGPAADA